MRDTKSFTFSSEDTPEAATIMFQEIQKACCRPGKACHLTAHKAKFQGEEVTYVTLSTSKEVTEKLPVIYDDEHVKGPAIGLWGERTLCHRQDFWPSDPCASVKRA